MPFLLKSSTSLTLATPTRSRARRGLLVHLAARGAADAHQHDPRRRAAQRSRGVGGVLRELRRLRRPRRLQIQRGVGTSTVGAASYGGSITFASVAPADERAVTAQAGAGSYGTARGTLALESGRLGSDLALYGRALLARQDGWRDHSGDGAADALSSARSQRGERSFLRVFGFPGGGGPSSRSYAVEPGRARSGPAHNPLAAGGDRRFRTGPPADRRWSTPRSAAPRPWRCRATTTARTARSSASGTTRGEAGPAEAGSTGARWGVQATGSFTGEAWSSRPERARRTPSPATTSPSSTASQAYTNTGRRRRLSGFAKLGLRPRARWHLFADCSCGITPPPVRRRGRPRPVAWTFVNPRSRVPASRSPSGRGSTPRWAARGGSRRATTCWRGRTTSPCRSTSTAVEPEEVVDWELGGDWRGESLTVRGNLYAMEFENEIAATGEQSALGYAIRRNLRRSHRRGVELELAWRATDRLTAARQRRLRRELDRHLDPGARRVRRGRQLGRAASSAPSRTRNRRLSPERIVGASLEWRPLDPLAMELSGRWVGRAQLDNTGDRRLSADPYAWSDLAVRLDLARFVRVGSPRLRLAGREPLRCRAGLAVGLLVPVPGRGRRGGEPPRGDPVLLPDGAPPRRARGGALVLSGGAVTDPLELLGVATGVVAVWLTVRQIVWCWPLGLVNVAPLRRGLRARPALRRRRAAGRLLRPLRLRLVGLAARRARPRAARGQPHPAADGARPRPRRDGLRRGPGRLPPPLDRRLLPLPRRRPRRRQPRRAVDADPQMAGELDSLDRCRYGLRRHVPRQGAPPDRRALPRLPRPRRARAARVVAARRRGCPRDERKGRPAPRRRHRARVHRQDDPRPPPRRALRRPVRAGAGPPLRGGARPPAPRHRRRADRPRPPRRAWRSPPGTPRASSSSTPTW